MIRIHSKADRTPIIAIPLINLFGGHCAARVLTEIIVYFVDLVKLVLLIWIDTKIILNRSIDHSSLTACDG